MKRAFYVGMTIALSCMRVFSADMKRETKWTEIRTSHFQVLTDGSVERARVIGEQLECLRETLDGRVESREDRRGRPLTVIAFRRGAELRRFAPFYDGKTVKLDGLYQDGERRQFIAVDASLQTLPHVVAHEYSHFLMERRARQYPVWLLEGLSEYFAGIATGEPRARKFGSGIGLTQLFSLSAESREYNEEVFHREFYDDASVATEYFWSNQERRQELERYLELTRAGMPMEEAIQRSFQISGEQLSNAIRGFAEQPRISESAGASCPVKIESEALAVSEVDARADLAEFKGQVAGHLRQAIHEFESILREKPGHPIALRGLAYALWKSGETAKAGGYFRLAAAADPTDHLLPYLYAIMLRSQGPDKDAAVRREMRTALTSSIALKADFAEAHHWLSLNYGWERDYATASQEAMKALELEPTNEQFKYNLALFYAQAQHVKEARGLCEQLRSSPDKDIAARAETLSHHLEKAQ